MSEVGVYEAKTHFTKLIDRVGRGERIVITRHGRPVAELRPVQDRAPEDIRAAIVTLREFRERNRRRLAGLKAKDLIEAGRKY